MEQAVSLNVPLSVKLNVGKHWDKLESYTVPPDTPYTRLPSDTGEMPETLNKRASVARAIFGKHADDEDDNNNNSNNNNNNNKSNNK